MSLWSRTPNSVRRSLVQLPQTALAGRLARRLTRNKLRILGFHGVEDPLHFRQVVSLIRARYEPVSADDVVAAILREHRLPELAVWMTFDDGLSSTFDAGDLLKDQGISATAFVCPSTIADPRRLWFQTVAAAEEKGIRVVGTAGHPRLSELKSAPDEVRRDYVAGLEEELRGRGLDPRPVGRHRLQEWIAQGHTIGNHTWDHPCLDTCREDEQMLQVSRAHEILADWGLPTRLFAYPNGNHTTVAESVLRELGYTAAVLFDHDLAGDLSNPLTLSRLRIDSGASLKRVDSLLSGAHSAAFQAGRRVLGRVGSGI
jgi:peptidoglycan/xylan/chitin deacetylase (PgdA/CDA1 family)